MSLIKDLPELVNANIISQDAANEISRYYKRKQDISPNRQLLIFGILGALLTGTGIVFIVANQWDQFPLFFKTACAFFLLTLPQLFCVYVLLKKAQISVWREIAALLLFFAVGANISLVSQIYHINGDMSTFLLTWMILTVPLIFLLDASALSLAYLFMSMIFCLSANMNGTFPNEEYLFWILFILPLLRYYQLSKKMPTNILVILHHWMVPYVLTQTLFTVSRQAHMLMHPAYIYMFAIFYFISQLTYFKGRTLLHNGYLVFGFAGAIISLLIMSFKASWKDLSETIYQFPNFFATPEYVACLLLFVLATILLYRQNHGKKWKEWSLMDGTYLIFLIIFALGVWFTELSVVLINLLLVVFGVAMLRIGSKHSQLGMINLGMLVIAPLVICRSFDTDLTFVVKGILFLLVGIGFFAANWLMIKKRKGYEDK